MPRIDSGLTGRELFKYQPNETGALLAEMSEWERSRYSLTKVLRHQTEDDAVDAGLEKEISQHIAKRLGREPVGMFVPTQLRSGLDAKTNAAGAFTVQTDVLDLIDLLRSRSRVIRLGARLLTNLDSNLSFPVEVAGTVGTWVGE